jgi:DNA-binding transcriptional LysR family regulator
MAAPSWELIHTFLHVLRAGSLSGAARSLRIAQPTVRRRIAALETEVGTPLFTRAPGGVVPTPAAERMRPLAETMEASARALLRTASGSADRVEGVVRIAVSEIVGVEVLPRHLASLRARHPALQVELVLSNTVADLLHREADVALRMTDPRQGSLVARRLGVVELGWFASPAYLAGRPPPRRLEDLRTFDLVGLDADPELREALAARGLPLRPRDFAVRTDHHLAYLAAIRAGLGVGVVHVPLATEPPLVRLLPEIVHPLDLWLVAHEDLRHLRRVRVVLDHLAEALADFVTPHRSGPAHRRSSTSRYVPVDPEPRIPMSDHATQLRHELDRALALPPDERLERLKVLVHDGRQLAVAQGEGMQGADVAPVLSEIESHLARLEQDGEP